LRRFNYININIIISYTGKTHDVKTAGDFNDLILRTLRIKIQLGFFLYKRENIHMYVCKMVNTRYLERDFPDLSHVRFRPTPARRTKRNIYDTQRWRPTGRQTFVGQ